MLPAQLFAAMGTSLEETQVVAYREIDGKSKALLALTVGVAGEIGSLGSTDLVARRDLASIFVVVVVAVAKNDTLVGSTGSAPADPGLALAESIDFDLVGTNLAGNTQTEWVDGPIESESAVGDLSSSRPILRDAGRQGTGR
jgi:hypothetical protein